VLIYDGFMLVVCFMRTILCLFPILLKLCSACLMYARRSQPCWDFVFNSRKSVVLRIGSRFERSGAPLSLRGAPLAYAEKVKYLGVIIGGSRYFKCSFEHVKSEFTVC